VVAADGGNDRAEAPVQANRRHWRVERCAQCLQVSLNVLERKCRDWVGVNPDEEISDERYIASKIGSGPRRRRGRLRLGRRPVLKRHDYLRRDAQDDNYSEEAR